MHILYGYKLASVDTF